MNILETIAATVQYRNAARTLPPFSASEDGRTLHCGAVSMAMLPEGWETVPEGDLIPKIEMAFVKLTMKAMNYAVSAAGRQAKTTEVAA